MNISLVKKARQLEARFAYYTSHKIAKHSYEFKARSQWKPQKIDQDILVKMKKRVHKLKQNSPYPSPAFSENELVSRIKQKTTEHNQNNVTRTTAYFTIYQKYPELHWALLAHLVSRNGGWNMTDLKGSLLNDVMKPTAQKDFFMFLECANAYIFHDAYPQLLLYEESKKKQKNHFHLLPLFGVSIFMKPVWDLFFDQQDSRLLTVALIINEQHYIEQRLISNDYYKEHVYESKLFGLQELFHFTNVIFPYKFREGTKLIGLDVSHFAPIEKRIELGKRLYVMLFEIHSIFEDIMLFVNDTPHTGSRSDYWPRSFSATKQNDVRSKTVEDKSLFQTIFSPTLEESWENVDHTFTDKDWYQTENTFFFFSQVKLPKKFEKTFEYKNTIHRIQTGSFLWGMSKNLING